MAPIPACAAGSRFVSAETKFDSGTGWPSFYAPIDESAVSDHEDRSFFMRRVENRCSRCDAHLGHVFSDGPQPTGLRYCMNGVALHFEPKARAEDRIVAFFCPGLCQPRLLPSADAARPARRDPA
jgi:methionine-R-sulfoxide reductase